MRLNNRIITAYLFSGLALTSSPIMATVTYDFSTLEPYEISYLPEKPAVTASFSYTRDDFLNLGSPDYFFLSPSDYGSCTTTLNGIPAACNYLIFQRSYLTSPFLTFNQVQFTTFTSDIFLGTNAYFEDGAFSNPGTYFSLGGIDGAKAKLVVSSSNTAAVPEPATWAMMLAGFAAVGFAMRRRTRMERDLQTT